MPNPHSMSAITIDAVLNRCLLSLPGGAKWARFQGRAASFAEQGMQGAANLAANVLLARSLSHEGFATIGTMLGIHYFVLGLHRTAIVLPFIVDAAEYGDNRKEALGHWWWLNLLALAVIAATLALLSLWCHGIAANRADLLWLVHALNLTVLVTPPLLFFEFGRRTLYQAGLPTTAAAISAIYLTALLATIGLLSGAGSSTEGAAIAWALAGLLSGLCCTLAVPPGKLRLVDCREAWTRNRAFAFWQALTSIPYAIYNSSVAVPVGLIFGPVTAATFNAARALTNPAISIVSAVDSMDKPKASHALANGGLNALHAAIRSTRKLLIMLTGTYLGLLMLAAAPITHWVFGPVYSGLANEIRLLCLAFLLMCLNQPSETLLIVLRESRLLLTIRCAIAVFAIAALMLAAPYGTIGCCTAMLLTQAVNLVALQMAERTCLKRHFARRPLATRHPHSCEASA